MTQMKKLISNGYEAERPKNFVEWQQKQTEK